MQGVRRRRKRDVLRAYVVRIFELNAEHGCFSDRLACELLTVLDLSLVLQPLDFEQRFCGTGITPQISFWAYCKLRYF